jgi:hypothetical protein
LHESKTFHIEPAVFVAQYPLVKHFIYHLIYHRVSSRGYKESGLKNEYWALTCDAHLLQATILWCMVFGSDAQSAVHWKRLATTESVSAELRKDFRKHLLRDIRLSQSEWQNYWEKIIDFRNNYAAHRALSPYDKPVPEFDTALAVAHSYDGWVRRVVQPATLAEPLLSAFEARLTRTTAELVRKLLKVVQNS